jgi:hypothetical protein
MALLYEPSVYEIHNPHHNIRISTYIVVQILKMRVNIEHKSKHNPLIRYKTYTIDLDEVSDLITINNHLSEILKQWYNIGNTIKPCTIKPIDIDHRKGRFFHENESYTNAHTFFDALFQHASPMILCNDDRIIDIVDEVCAYFIEIYTHILDFHPRLYVTQCVYAQESTERNIVPIFDRYAHDDAFLYYFRNDLMRIMVNNYVKNIANFKKRRDVFRTTVIAVDPKDIEDYDNLLIEHDKDLYCILAKENFVKNCRIIVSRDHESIDGTPAGKYKESLYASIVLCMIDMWFNKTYNYKEWLDRFVFHEISNDLVETIRCNIDPLFVQYALGQWGILYKSVLYCGSMHKLIDIYDRMVTGKDMNRIGQVGKTPMHIEQFFSIVEARRVRKRFHVPKNKKKKKKKIINANRDISFEDLMEML